jgi:hypothetical protein
MKAGTDMSEDDKKNAEQPDTKRSGYSRPQRIAALVGLILIFGLAVTTLVVAITDSTGRLFQSFLMLTIAAPILTWIYIWLYGKYERRHTIASFDFFGRPSDTDVPSDGHGDSDSGK